MTAATGTALVTGAARRVGRRLALDLAADGWTVAVHFNGSEAEARSLAEEIRGAGGRVGCYRGDLGDAALPARLVGQVRDEFGSLRLLVNNAACFEPDEIDTLTPESWSRHLDVNLRAPVLLTQAFAAALPEDAEGNVVNIVDQRVLKPNPRFFSYSASKAALWWTTRTLAQALAPRIRVNAIAPGPTLASSRMRPEDFARQAEATLLGRATDPADISAALRFILATPSMTGQLVALDSGQHLLWRTPDMEIASE